MLWSYLKKQKKITNFEFLWRLNEVILDKDKISIYRSILNQRILGLNLHMYFPDTLYKAPMFNNTIKHIKMIQDIVPSNCILMKKKNGKHIFSPINSFFMISNEISPVNIFRDREFLFFMRAA